MQVVQPLLSVASLVLILGMSSCGDSATSDPASASSEQTALQLAASKAMEQQPAKAGMGEYRSVAVNADTIMNAAREGNAEMVRLLIGEGAPVDTVLPDGLCALHVAVAEGHFEVTKLLLENNANPNPKQAAGATPLIAALQAKRLDLVKLLLEHRADPTIAMHNGNFPLVLLDVFKWDPNVQPEVAELMLQAGADINQRIGPKSNTALMVYAAVGNTQMVKWLLSRGAEIDLRGDKGYTAINFAGVTNNIETARLLVEAGADLSIRNNHGATPLEVAIETKQAIASYFKQQEAKQLAAKE